MLVEEGQKRKSVRIAAIQAAKRNKRKRSATTSCQNDIPSVSGQSHPQPDRRRCRKRKSLAEVGETSVSPSPQQDGGEQSSEIKGDGDLPSMHPLPERHFLENALNILQRTDTQNIFAQPVDDAVDYYYLVITEPMDFSTLRAKLQKDAYETFKEFEYDVLLISNNALFFNGETTSYHKQAQALKELSKRVLDTLRTDPEKLEQLERDLSQEKRRPGRRGRGKAESLRTNKQRIKKQKHQYDPCSSSNQLVNQDQKINSGSRYRAAKKFIANRDSWEPAELIVPEIFSGPKLLFPGDGFGIGYRESLARFTKNLGPVAQMVAARKLSNMVPDYSSRSHIPASCFPETNFSTTSSFAPRGPSFADGLFGARGGGHGRNVTDKGKNVITDNSIQGGQRSFGGSDFFSSLGRLAPERRGIRILGDSRGNGASRERMSIPSGSHGKAANTVGIVDSPASSGEIIQLADREFLQAYVNDVCGIDQNSNTAVAGIKGFDSLAYRPTAVRDETFQENQKFLNQLGSYYLSHAGTVNLNIPSAGITSQFHNQVPRNQLAPGSQSSLLEATPKTIRSTTKSSVYPSTYLRPSKFSRTSNLLHGLGSCSQTDGSLNHGYAASSAQVSPFEELSQPTMCNPQEVDGLFGENPFGKAFAQQEYEPLGPYQRLLNLGEGSSDQEAQSTAATDMQPLPMIEWGQNAAAEEELHAAAPSIMETRDTDVNLPCKNSWAPMESNPLGLGQARSYPQRLGVDEQDLAAWLQQQQSQTAAGPSQVHGQWRSTLPLDREAALEQERLLMPPPGERMFSASRTIDGRDLPESQEVLNSFEQLWRSVPGSLMVDQQHQSLGPDQLGSKRPPPGF